MYLDYTNNPELGERLAQIQEDDERLALAARDEYTDKFGVGYSAGNDSPSDELPDGYTVIGAVGWQAIIAETGTDLTDETVVWPYPLFKPEWAAGFPFGVLKEEFAFTELP